MTKLRFWFNNARPISLPQSMLPALTAVALSYSRADGSQFSWVAAIASLFGVMLLHLGMNLLDDWFDYKESRCYDLSEWSFKNCFFCNRWVM